MRSIIQDLRYGCRMLLQRPGFTGVVVITLALGIGANTGMFSVVNGVLIRQLPYPEPDRLVHVTWRFHVGHAKAVSAPKFLFYREHSDSFTAVAIHDLASSGFNITGDGEPERVRGMNVSEGIFATLGVIPTLGRGFSPSEDVPGGPDVTVISHGLWQRRFGGDPGVIGRTVLVDGQSHSIVGVLPAGVQHTPRADIWTPLRPDPNTQALGNSFTMSAAATASSLPMETGLNMPIEILGRSEDRGGVVEYRAVSWEYFRAMRTPVIRGRSFDEGETSTSSPVLLINETAAKRFWHGDDPLEDRVSLYGGAFNDPPRRVVGVVGDIREMGLEFPAAPTIYVPRTQVPDQLARLIQKAFPVGFVIQTAGSVDVAQALRSTILAADPQQPVANIRPMTQLVGDSVARQRFNTLLMGLFAALALLLTTTGIYGVLSYHVSRRTHEIGIRLALGAERRSIYRLIVGEGMTFTLLGIGIGIVASLGLSRVLAGLLFGIGTTEPKTLAAVSLTRGTAMATF